jgi:hypothetical protein
MHGGMAADGEQRRWYTAMAVYYRLTAVTGEKPSRAITNYWIVSWLSYDIRL